MNILLLDKENIMENWNGEISLKEDGYGGNQEGGV